MAIIRRVRSVSTGLPGSPYLSTFNFLQGVVGVDAQDLNDVVQQFWTDIRNNIAAPWAELNEGEVYTIDEATGDLTGAFPVSPTATTAGSTGAEWTAKQGLVTMRTNRYLRGRRVLGHLYIPGVTNGAGDQAPSATYQNVANSALDNLISNSAGLNAPWCVYSRPTTPGASDGVGSVITQASVKGYWGVLRSRRQ